MASFSEKVERTFRSLLPSPFSIAILLSIVCFVCVYIFQKPITLSNSDYITELIGIWTAGIWSSAGLVFLVQMMLMLILGHVLALTQAVKKAISLLTNIPRNNSQAAALICIATMAVSFFNWGLGLIFGAILAKSTHQHLVQKNIAHNYPLLAACGYVGLMVWHGGLSGSSLIKIAEAGHLETIAPNNIVPDFIPITATVFSLPNMLCWLGLFILIPLSMFWLGKKNKRLEKDETTLELADRIEVPIYFAERFESKKIYSVSLGVLFLVCLLVFLKKDGFTILFTPNNLNFLLLILCLTFSKNLSAFMRSLNIAMKDGAGILIQFPIYFGIMALMSETGFASNVAQFFVANASADSFPVLTLISSGIINIFVPSGGGQWLVQAPILVESCLALNIPLEKGIMALAYGDQLTNMLQPFWALPLLGITGLKAQKIFPYTLVLFLIGALIFSVTIWLW